MMMRLKDVPPLQLAGVQKKGFLSANTYKTIYIIMASISFGDRNRGLQVAHSSGEIHAEIHLPPGMSGTGQDYRRLLTTVTHLRETGNPA
jgi:hypothetical protein